MDTVQADLYQSWEVEDFLGAVLLSTFACWRELHFYKLTDNL